MDAHSSADGGDYGAGIGPGLGSGFGRRSTAGSTPSNPGPADSPTAKRVDMGPEKIKNKNSPKKVKPAAKQTKKRAQTRTPPKKSK
jgi:hypothetical protein